MIPYLIAFTSAIGLTFFGQKLIGRKKIAGIIVFLLVIVGLSLFAALRDYSVGADVISHKQIYFDTALQYDSIWKYFSLFNNEYLFQGFVYAFAHVFGSYRVLLFLFTAIPLSVLFYYGYKNNPKHLSLFLAVYLLMFFNTSLNVIRQVMAISCIIPAFFLLQNNKKVRSVILIIVASLFHLSAVLMFVLPLINYFSSKKKQVFYYCLICFSFLILCSMLSMLTNSDIIAAMGYSSYFRLNETNMNLLLLILKICMLVFATYFYKNYKNDIKCRNYYYFVILDLLFYFFSNFVKYGYRLSYYFVIFYPFLIASIADRVEKKEKMLLYVGTTVALILYWFARNVFIGYDMTIPYLVGGDLL